MSAAKFALGAALLVAASASAEAACSTAAMAGKWTVIGQDQVCTASVSTTGVISGVHCSSAPTTWSGQLSLSSACVLSGTIAGNSVKGRSNPIASTSAAKPTMAMAASLNGNVAFSAFRQ